MLFMLTVSTKYMMPSVIMPNVISPNVAAPTIEVTAKRKDSLRHRRCCHCFSTDLNRINDRHVTKDKRGKKTFFLIKM
jgi:hypothetical protein